MMIDREQGRFYSHAFAAGESDNQNNHVMRDSLEEGDAYLIHDPHHTALCELVMRC